MMISFTTAQKIIQDHLPQQSTIKQATSGLLGKVSAENICAPLPMPHFRQSAMDGYAIKLSNNNHKYVVIGESQAGTPCKTPLKEHEAIRIFTGAMVPDTADTVIMQEHVEKKGNHISITKQPTLHANIRPIGEQLQKGDLLIKKGTLLNSKHLALLAMFGIQSIETYQDPRIGIITTGNELLSFNSPLSEGMVYDSNALMLKTILQEHGFSNIKHYYTRDTQIETNRTIATALHENDVVIISGGISVGDYDYVRKSLKTNQVKELFYKINQKPGKPMWFGKKGNQLVFALPGNPASTLACFYLYALPALKQLKGTGSVPIWMQAQTIDPIENNTHKSLFLKAKVENNQIEILDGRPSSMIYSFSTANALAYIPEHQKSIGKNQPINYMIL